jgi:uncharacterized membrane protein
MDSQPQSLAQDVGPPRHPVYFDAEWRPSRSLSPRAFTLLMAGLALVSFSAGYFFMRLGAWPVSGFFGLDLALFYLAFRVSYRSGRVRERVRLDAADLIVRRQTAKGEVYAWRFEPTWARVEHNRAQRGLALRSHGRRLILARFLGEDERGEIARRLQAALAAWSEDLTRRDDLASHLESH